MCVGEPMQVVSVVASEQGGAPVGAECLGSRGLELVDVSLIGAVAPQEWLLVFLGAARERLTEQRADEIRRALEGVAAAMRGEDLGGAFADLEAAPPKLPAHLEAARRRGAGTA